MIHGPLSFTTTYQRATINKESGTGGNAKMTTQALTQEVAHNGLDLCFLEMQIFGNGESRTVVFEYAFATYCC